MLRLSTSFLGVALRRISVLLVGFVLAWAAPQFAASAGSADAGAERYIVVLDDSISSARSVANEHARAYGARVSHVYEHALKGYAATMAPQAAARLLEDRRVKSVEVDQVAQTLGQSAPFGVNRIDDAGDPGISSLESLTIDAIDRRVDVDVAVIDTGIDDTHPDLNVAGGVNCTVSPCQVRPPGDGNGHGTHVAGTIGALDNNQGVVGVAPGARLWAVKVLSDTGSGYFSWITAGIDWITANGQIEVANMSLGGGASSSDHYSCGSSTALHNAICNSVATGVSYVVAAGNSGTNAEGSVPATYPEVITVSALADFNGRSGSGAAATCRSDVDDTFADFSNYGVDVDLIAPGVCIESTWKGGSYNTISGTSMASPHVAGAAAVLASNTTYRDNPDAIKLQLVNTAVDDWSGDRDSIKEPRVDVTTAAPVTGTNVAPTVTITGKPCVGATCTFTGSAVDGDVALAIKWSFGDGTAFTSPYSHKYTSSGTHVVVLSGTDAEGFTTKARATVTCSWSGKGNKKTLSCS
jgi:subtilisin